jgi:hypothetical protein
VYHNLGGKPGDAVVLREERELSGSGGWIGAEGLFDPELRGTYDLAALDVDGDGWDDLILGRTAGTRSGATRPAASTASRTSASPAPATRAGRSAARR